jgi:hypothetical protein
VVTPNRLENNQRAFVQSRRGHHVNGCYTEGSSRDDFVGLSGTSEFPPKRLLAKSFALGVPPWCFLPLQNTTKPVPVGTGFA